MSLRLTPPRTGPTILVYNPKTTEAKKVSRIYYRVVASTAVHHLFCLFRLFFSKTPAGP